MSRLNSHSIMNAFEFILCYSLAYVFIFFFKQHRREMNGHTHTRYRLCGLMLQ